MFTTFPIGSLYLLFFHVIEDSIKKFPCFIFPIGTNVSCINFLQNVDDGAPSNALLIFASFLSDCTCCRFKNQLFTRLISFHLVTECWIKIFWQINAGIDLKFL